MAVDLGLGEVGQQFGGIFDFSGILKFFADIAPYLLFLVAVAVISYFIIKRRKFNITILILEQVGQKLGFVFDRGAIWKSPEGNLYFRLQKRKAALVKLLDYDKMILSLEGKGKLAILNKFAEDSYTQIDTRVKTIFGPRTIKLNESTNYEVIEPTDEIIKKTLDFVPINPSLRELGYRELMSTIEKLSKKENIWIKYQAYFLTIITFVAIIVIVLIISGTLKQWMNTIIAGQRSLIDVCKPAIEGIVTNPPIQ